MDRADSVLIDDLMRLSIDGRLHFPMLSGSACVSTVKTLVDVAEDGIRGLVEPSDGETVLEESRDSLQVLTD